MKLKIRQPDLSYSIEIKQLPSKQVFIFTLKKQSKNFLVPIKILILPSESAEPLRLTLSDGWTNSDSINSEREFIKIKYETQKSIYESALSKQIEDILDILQQQQQN